MAYLRTADYFAEMLAADDRLQYEAMQPLTSPLYTHKDKHMKASQMIESKYLKQEDVDEDTPVTVQLLKKVNVARDDETPEYRWTIKFHEFDKPMVLNATNIKRLSKALGDDTDGWEGNSVILYVDPDIEYAGKVVGGLRLKAIPRTSAKQSKRTPGDVDSDVPF